MVDVYYPMAVPNFVSIDMAIKTDYILPLRVQNVVTRIAVELHNSLVKQDSIH